MATLGEQIAAWANAESSIRALILIGSRVRSNDDVVWRADAQSDWDFHVVTSRPEVFESARWLEGIPGLKVTHYVVRATHLGHARKVSASLANGEVDLVLIPLRERKLSWILLKLGLHRRRPGLRRAFQELAVVFRPGYRFFKGEAAWGSFYRQVLEDMPDPRLSNREARGLADALAVDVLWTRRKIARGELAAAQRMLHRAIAETNLALLHELKLRRGQRSFPEARRLERIATPEEIGAVMVSARPEPAELSAALEMASATCAKFLTELLALPEVRA